jgi:DNA-binding beta-propeller fold protein YncE
MPDHRRPMATIAAAVLAGAITSTALGTAAAARTATARAIHVRNIAVGGMPDSVAIDSPLRAAWVAATRLVRISERTQRVVARITTHPGVNRVAVDPNRHAVWATACLANCAIVEVSEATNRIVHRVAGPAAVSGIAVDPRTGLVWLAARDVLNRPNVLAISEATRRVVRSIRLHIGNDHELGSIAVDPRTGTVWASVIPADPRTSRTYVSEISEAKPRVLAVYPREVVNGEAITAVDSARGTAWVTFGSNREPGTIEVINIAKRKVIKVILGDQAAPGGLAIDSRHSLVAAAGGVGGGHQDTALIISESSGKVIKQVPMGLFPAQLAVDPAAGNVYVPIVFRAVVTRFHE